MIIRETVDLGDRRVTLETGRIAKQAHGAVLVSCADTVILVTAVGGTEERPGIDFFPMSVDYVEKTYAAGKIPGGFFKREGRLRDEEVLVSRLIDRPCRPLFPEGYRAEVQIIATVLSVDKVNPSDVLALTGASAALHLSDIPWAGPIAGVRVGRVEGRFIANPTYEEIQRSDCDIIVAASKDAITMVEGSAAEMSEDDLLEALMFAHSAVQPIIGLIERMREAVGKPKRSFAPAPPPAGLADRVAASAREHIRRACSMAIKHERYDAFKVAKKAVVAELAPEFPEQEKKIGGCFEDLRYDMMRDQILGESRRVDGRSMTEIRPITSEVGFLPRVHGSALFTRGETQAIVTATLGTSQDEQKIDALIGERWKPFMLHYNFPPFSVGETKPLRGPGRREIGHGNLAERAILRVLPGQEQFPYTVRVVSEVTESNGSSSMATVCGATLALMDAGVPIRAPVAGVAMGLIKTGDRWAVLSDILGDEDHLGDMDFKVCGTERGITAIQMDIKIEGLNREILRQALKQARDGRLHVLSKMAEALSAPRPDLSQYAPRITTIKVKPDQVRLIIGPGGKTIKGIVAQTGVTIDVEDDGTVAVASSDAAAAQRALDIIKGLTAEPEIGMTYTGTVRRIMDFGAFVEILPGTDGLLHVSEIDWAHVKSVTDYVNEGDTVEVKVVNVDRDGKIRLSRKELLPRPEGMPESTGRREGGGDRGDRGDRGGDRRGDRRDRGGERRGDRGERRAGDRGGDRGAGDRGAGDRGPGDRGAGDRGPGDRGPGDRGAGDRGAGDRGAADRGAASDRGADRGAGDRGASDRGERAPERGDDQAHGRDR